MSWRNFMGIRVWFRKAFGLGFHHLVGPISRYQGILASQAAEASSGGPGPEILPKDLRSRKSLFFNDSADVLMENRAGKREFSGR